LAGEAWSFGGANGGELIAFSDLQFSRLIGQARGLPAVVASDAWVKRAAWCPPLLTCFPFWWAVSARNLREQPGTCAPLRLSVCGGLFGVR